MRPSNVLILILLAGAVAAAQTGPSVCNVTDYGALGDGQTNNAAAIQRAVDACASRGGGAVYIPAGKFVAGTVQLKSRVQLYLAPGATLAGSANPDDYSPRYLLFAENAEDVSIAGNGTIDGNGHAFFIRDRPRFYHASPLRPQRLIRFVHCRNVRMSGITIHDSPSWTVHLLHCDGVKIHGISIDNDMRGPNTDGIDVDSSRNVSISDTDIRAADDCIVLKTTGQGGSPVPTENVNVTNCTLSSSSNCLKLGTESLAGFRNIAFTNCTLYKVPGNFQPPISGLAIEMVDGAKLDGLVVSNIAMREVGTPIFIRLGNRGRGMQTPIPGILQNVLISNVVATGAVRASLITGLPGHPVRNVTLSDIDITVQGGEDESRGLQVPENESQYPEATMFGTLPAYGIYCRHADGLTMRNVQVRWEKLDRRPALIFDDVKALDLDGFKTGTVTGNVPVIWLHQVVDALVRGSRVPAGTSLFARVSGGLTRRVRIGKDGLTARRDVEVTGGASRSAVR